MIKNKSKNLFENNVAGTLTVNGATIESFGNGEFLINGTTSTGSRVSLFNEINFQTTLAGIIANANDVPVKNSTNYKISLLVVSGSVSNPVDSSIVLNQPSLNTINTIRLDNSNEVSFISTTTTAYFYMFLANTSTFTNYRVKFQIEEGTTRTAYVPYNDIQVAVGQFEQAVLTDRFLSVHNPASNDIPIPALNNKTLNEVFVGGNLVVNPEFTNGTTGWSGSLSGANSQLSVSNNNLFITNAGNVSILLAGQIVQLLTTVGHNYYINSKMRVVNRNANSLELGNSSWGYIIQSNPIQNQWYNMSGIRTAVTPNHNYLLLSRYSGAEQTTPIQEVDYAYAINLTSLGIASLTQAQMDAYFEAWQRNNAGTLLANTFIQHDQNSVPIADLNGKTLDEVFVGGQVNTFVTSISNINGILIDRSLSPNLITVNGTATGTVNASIYSDLISTSSYYLIHNYISGSHSRRFINSASATIISEANMQQNNTLILTDTTNIRLSHVNGTIADNYNFAMPLINLTALGITATKEQLDFWYSVWQQNHKLGMRVHRASGNDIPLAVLNNQSLNQVFSNNNNITLNDLTISSSLVSYQYEDDGSFTFVMNNVVSSSPNRGLYATNLLTENDVYYQYIIIKSDLPTNTRMFYRTLDFNPTTNHTFYSILETMSFGAFGNYVAIGNRTTTETQYNIKDVQWINLTSLGIATLTKSQLDYLYQVWQFNQVNALVARQFIQEA